MEAERDKIAYIYRDARIFRDANIWCAAGPFFIDPVVSAFGTGKSPQEAYENWLADAKKHIQWKDKILPSFEDFVIEQ